MAKPDKNAGLIRIPASITKAELEQVCPLYGATNAGPVAGRGPGTLRLKTFAGRYDLGTRRFVGEYWFTLANGPGESTFSELPGLETKAKAGKAKAEPVEAVTNG